MSLNKVLLIGNVGKKPEVRYLDGNSSNAVNNKVAQFPLATTERFKDRDGAIRENTEWHNIVAWRGLADTCERFVEKGTQLYVEGKLKTRSWTDQTGSKRYTTEIQADNIQLLGKRQDSSEGGYSQAPQQGGYQQPVQAAASVQRPSYTQPAQPAEPVDLGEGPSDDLPF